MKNIIFTLTCLTFYGSVYGMETDPTNSQNGQEQGANRNPLQLTRQHPPSFMGRLLDRLPSTSSQRPQPEFLQQIQARALPALRFYPGQVLNKISSLHEFIALKTFSFTISNETDDEVSFLADDFKIPQSLKRIDFDYSHTPPTNYIIVDAQESKTRSLKEVTFCLDYLLKVLSKENVDVHRIQFFFKGPVHEEVREKASVKYKREWPGLILFFPHFV